MRNEKVELLPQINSQATITIKPYMTALTFNNEGEVYMVMIKEDYVDKLVLQENHTIHLNNRIQKLSLKELEELSTGDMEDAINMSMLRIIYSSCHKKFEQDNNRLKDTRIHIYLPSLLKSMGRKPNLSRGRIEDLVAEINKLKRVIGVMKKVNGGRIDIRYYRIIEAVEYDATSKIISMNVPYIWFIIRKTYEVSLTNNNVKRGYSKKPTHSYLINSSIAKERNKAAIENVNIIITLIEQAGNSRPHIRAKTIVERNHILLCQLYNCTKKNRQRVIDTCFKKTWELLRTMTTLTDVYKNIQLPESTQLPKLNSLAETVYEFKHDGKSRT